jgi:hypothetical protein
MSIFRETFPAFVQDELQRRQDGMLTRNPTFLHQLNSRSAWVRMTSGVDFEGSSALAKNYVLQGGVLNHSIQDKKDSFTQKNGLGDSSNAYSNKSQGGAVNRTGIRPMPGITNVSIQSKGAYGSLQEATVTFNCWDIKQLEELELLYMRPGYTVLLEFGWDFARVKGALPSYDILNQSDITLNDAFAQIYELIDQSNGTYDALLGYVKNYNWAARDDGGYDCTTSIISLGEVLESLKCNWVPGETIAFDNSGKGILQIANNKGDKIIESYEKGIIPGLIQELWNSIESKPNKSTNIISDPRTGDYYYLYKQDIYEDKNNRGGLAKNLGQGSKTEVYITLGSFCDLLSTYVFPKGAKNQPLSELVTYETDYKSKSYIKYSAKNSTNSVESRFNSQKPSNAYATSLKCIASPLALSTNLGICYVRNDNWNNLEVQTPTTPFNASVNIPADIALVVEKKAIGYGAGNYPNAVFNRFAPNITKKEYTVPQAQTSIVNFVQSLIPTKFYDYKSALGLQGDIDKFATDLGAALINVDFPTSDLRPRFSFYDGTSFTSTTTVSDNNTVNLLDYLGPAEYVYGSLFTYNYDPTPPGKLNLSPNSGPVEDPFDESDLPVTDNLGTKWTRQSVINALQKALSNVSLNPILQKSLENQVPAVANQVANAASSTSSKNTLPFLVDNNSDTKQLGYISNIYVNLNYLYEQAISKNTASNDTQNKNTISIRDYIQGIMRDVQNSLGNVNSFDIQVDNRNAIGRIIDINFTGDPTQKLFELQIHNLNSVVRDYKFSSKIFPEMGSIIAISAQDATGIGKLGYDNSTLVAWNRGISDRLIPKKDFNSTISLAKTLEPASFLLPFLTKIYNYFQYINGVPNGKNKDDFNYAYGGLDFAYRDFLSNLDRFDPRNQFKTIIPTELTITLDGLGGIIIGNIFKINQDIVPKGYKNVSNRSIAYIVTRLGHQISENDWTTELSAYPIVFENSKGTQVWKQWDDNQYPGATIINVGGRRIIIPSSQAIQDTYIPARDKALSNRSNGIKLLLTAQAQLEGFKPGNINFDLNNPGNFTGPVGSIPTAGRGEGSRSKFVKYASLEDGIKASAAQVDLIVNGKSSVYPKNATLSQYINKYAPESDANKPKQYIDYIINYFKQNGYDINENTKLSEIIVV